MCLVCLWSCFRLSWIFVSEIFEALIYGLQCMRYRERVLSSFIFWIESHQTSTILSTLLSSASLNCYLICLLLRSVWFLQTHLDTWQYLFWHKIFSRSCFVMIGAGVQLNVFMINGNRASPFSIVRTYLNPTYLFRVLQTWGRDDMGGVILISGFSFIYFLHFN